MTFIRKVKAISDLFIYLLLVIDFEEKFQNCFSYLKFKYIIFAQFFVR